MAVDLFSESWGSYRRAVNGFYEVAVGAIENDDTLDANAMREANAALEEAVRWSREVGEAGEAVLLDGTLRNRPYSHIVTLLAAAAAVDCMVACHALHVDPQPIEPDQRFVERAAAAGAGSAEEASALLRQADDLFGAAGEGPAVAAGGQEVDYLELRDECIQELGALVNAANDPAGQFSFGAIGAMGVGPLAGLAAGSAIHGLHAVAAKVGWIKRHAVKLLGEGVRKLLIATGEEAAELALDRIREAVRQQVTWILGTIAGRRAAVDRVTTFIVALRQLPADRVAETRKDLSELNADYAKTMRWTEEIATWVSRLSPLISGLATALGAPGPIVILSIDVTGVGFVWYTLAVRLEGYRLPARVDGVLTILRQRLPPTVLTCEPPTP